jgi:pilus assembly protein Flp/PilA
MRAQRRGQSLTEVAIVLALIAIAAIGVITVYGDEVRKLFGDSAGATAGETDLERSGYPGAKTEKHNLGNFAKQNSADCAGGVCTYH